MLSADEEAEFWGLYEETSKVLFRKAFRMCRGHRDDADDALQRTYLIALERWPDLSGLVNGQRRSWLATTLMREVLQIWRSQHRARETELQDDAERPKPGTPDSADAIWASDRYHDVCRAIAMLQGRQRDVVALHCLAGYEISEVADMLGIHRSTVRVHLHAGRHRLREILAGEEGPA